MPALGDTDAALPLALSLCPACSGIRCPLAFQTCPLPAVPCPAFLLLLQKKSCDNFVSPFSPNLPMGTQAQVFIFSQAIHPQLYVCVCVCVCACN